MRAAVLRRPVIDLSAAVFAQHLHTTFTVESEDGTRCNLELAEVSQRREQAGYESFSLVFHGPAATAFGQGTRRLVHAELGGLDVFLVPIAPAGGTARYEAVFNVLRSDEVVPNG
jgi:hypothetical protein